MSFSLSNVHDQAVGKNSSLDDVMMVYIEHTYRALFREYNW